MDGAEGGCNGGVEEEAKGSLTGGWQCWRVDPQRLSLLLPGPPKKFRHRPNTAHYHWHSVGQSAVIFVLLKAYANVPASRVSLLAHELKT
jgi:hypothetical protein